MGALRFFAFCLLLIVLILPSAFGSGFMFDGLGVKARGMGGAFRALADDWSAAYYNPAGYNLIQDNYIAGNVAVFHNRYTAIPDITWNGYESGFYNGVEVYNEHEVLNVPQGAILTRLPIFGETVMGFSIMQIFDQNQSWELFANIPVYNTSTIPSKQFYNNLDVVAFQVTAAKGFSEDKLSLGIGLSLLRGDGMGWGFGYRAGMLYKLTDKINVGVVFSGQTSIDIDGESNFRYYLGDNPSLAENFFDTTEERYFLDGNVAEVSADFETSFDTPNSIAAGIACMATDRLTLAVDGEWVFWSQFEGFEFTYTNYGRIMAGASYKLNNFAELRGGFGVDQTALTEETFIPQFIDLNTKYSYSLGVGVEIGFWHLDIATSYIHYKDLDVPNQTDFDGDGLMDNFSAYYEGDNYQTVLGISYRF